MGAPLKVGISYFPMDTDFFSDPKIKLLISKYKADGIAAYLYVIVTAYDEHGYYLPYDEDNMLLLSGTTGIEYGKVNEIIEFMCGKKLFNAKQKEVNGILTNVRMQKVYINGTARRSEVSFQSEYLLIDPVKEKGKSHKAKIVIDERCITETELIDDNMYNNNSVNYNSNTQSEKESESDNEREINKKSETGALVNNQLVEKIKSYYRSYSKIADPNTGKHIAPLLKLYEQIPEAMSIGDIDACVEAGFKMLSPGKGVMVSYLLDNIERKITAMNEAVIKKKKDKELKEAREMEERNRIKEKNEEKKINSAKLNEYKEFLKENKKLFTADEMEKINDCLRRRNLFGASVIIEAKKEEAEEFG